MSTNPPPAADAVAVPEAPNARRPVAPVWHTAIFLTIVFVAAAVSAEQHGAQLTRHGHLFTYLFTMGWEWLLVGFVLWGARRNGVTLKDLVGGKWKSPEDGLIDVAIAVGFWIAAALVLVLAAAAAGLVSPENLEAAKKMSTCSSRWACWKARYGFASVLPRVSARRSCSADTCKDNSRHGRAATLPPFSCRRSCSASRIRIKARASLSW